VHYFAANRIIDALRDADAPAPPRRSVGAGELTPEPTLM
jgi:hypothetical protein